MKSWSVHHPVLLLLILVPVADLCLTSLTAKLHQPATLTCNQKCPGLMKWKMFSNPDDVARCDQKSCFPKEEFEISHDQYLNGNLDLVIRSAGFSKRTLYTCYCGDTAVCDVHLIIEPLVSQVQKMPGEDLVLDLPIQEPTAVDYKSKDSTDLYGESICTLTYGSLQCGTDYKQRVSLSHTELTLRELKVSDSGVYIIRDMKNKEVIHTYMVSVGEYCPQPLEKPERAVSNGTIVPAAVIPPLVLFGMIGIIFYRWKMSKIEDQKPRKERLLSDEEERVQGQERPNSNERISQLMKLISAVNTLIRHHRIREEQGPQDWLSSRDIIEGPVQRKKEEMEEFMQIWNGRNSEMIELNEWWSIKKSDLDEILEQCRRDKSKRQNFELIGQRRTKSDEGLYHRRAGNGLMQTRPRNVIARRTQLKRIRKQTSESQPPCGKLF